VASVWLTTRVTCSGEKRYRTEYRVGGRESKTRYGGSFKTKREALARQAWIAGELASLRVPNLGLLSDEPKTSTVAAAGEQWLASRVDIAEATKTRHGLELARIRPLLGSRPVDELTPADVAGFVAALSEDYARGTIRRNLQTLAMNLEHAGISPNPVRDKQVRLPRAEEEEINPPSAEHVEAVYRLLPPRHRLALLWLDWSGARVSSVDLTLVGDYDEPRRRVRLRAATTKTRKALWVEFPDVLAEAIEATLPPREDRDPEARLYASSGADALRTSIAKACKAAAIPLFSPHDLRHRRISLLHLRGVPWARIGEFVGQRNLSVTADTYTHVLVDEAELNYGRLLVSGLKTPECDRLRSAGAYPGAYLGLEKPSFAGSFDSSRGHWELRARSPCDGGAHRCRAGPRRARGKGARRSHRGPGAYEHRPVGPAGRRLRTRRDARAGRGAGGARGDRSRGRSG
jgi:integrase